MPYRLTKIYTRQGDEGYTRLGDKKISKDDLLVEALGTIDELNSAIGVIISQRIQTQEIESELTRIQNDLFDMGGELHLPDRVVITPEKITHLEQVLDKWNDTLPPLTEFVLPRGNSKTAFSHLARTICRRAERCLVKLHRQVPLNNAEMLRYLNRLSDLLFVIARVLAKESNEKELLWEQDRSRHSEERGD